jgi:hypothetical protein
MPALYATAACDLPRDVSYFMLPKHRDSPPVRSALEPAGGLTASNR